MALPSSGAINMGAVNLELQKAAKAALALGNGEVRLISGMTSGPSKLGSVRGKQKTLSVNCGGGVNVNLFHVSGSPTVAVTANITITGVCGSNDPNAAACVVGAFPAGSTVNITVNANILGAGGAPGNYFSNGGHGGTALNVEYGGFRINVTNNASIYGGGGGGGAGGFGGHGGNGGGGYYTYGTDRNVYPGASGNVATNDWHYACRVYFGSRAWCHADAVQFYGDCYQSCGGKDGACSTICPTLYTRCNQCGYTVTDTNYVYTNGGAGGAAIRGSNGGTGYGYQRQWANSNQPEGNVGFNGGAGGGTNAGAGGRSGYGGNAGWGGGWGEYGGNGAAGEAGQTGAGGNNGGGAGGGAGGGGASGGRAGYWVEAGTANWGITNNGSLAGLSR